MLRRTLRRTCLLLAGASLLACSSKGSNAPSLTDGGDVIPAADAQQPATQTVGASGGTVQADGVVLTIPPGALSSDVQISIVPAGSAPTGYSALSPLFQLEPSGTTFLSPVTLVLTLTSAGASATVFLSDGAGGYDALVTTNTSTSASAATTHLGNCFVGVAQGSDGGADSGSGGSVADGGSSIADSGSVGTTSGATVASDSGAIGDTGAPVDTGAAAAETSTGDAGLAGISVTIDGVPTTFDVNPSVSNSGPDTSLPDSTVQADDNATSTHWQMQLTVTGAATQTCEPFQQPTYPQIIYTHFTAGTADVTFSTHSSNIGAATCSITLVGSAPTSPGDQASGTFSGTVYGTTPDAGAAHVLTMGSYDETL